MRYVYIIFLLEEEKNRPHRSGHHLYLQPIILRRGETGGGARDGGRSPEPLGPRRRAIGRTTLFDRDVRRATPPPQLHRNRSVRSPHSNAATVVYTNAARASFIIIILFVCGFRYNKI